MRNTKQFFLAGIAALPAVPSMANAADDAAGMFYVNFNLRQERVAEDNDLDDASALTLRTRIGYESRAWQGFSALVELEDSRIVAGQDEFTVGPTGFRPGQYSVIADPESTELDQGYLKFEDGAFVAKLGRQVIVRDNQRFVGSVDWRQDRQTFDAVSVGWAASDSVDLEYAYVTKRNRVFADAADVDSRDQLVNGRFETQLGTFAAYAYLLETDGADPDELDTLGLRYTGAAKRSFGTLSWALEYASQDHRAPGESGGEANDADYLLAEGGVGVHGVDVTLGYERLGSDGGSYGFSTPLATLHKFNGWADQFLATPAQGLVDVYLSVGGSVRGAKWLLAYHDFAADEALDGADDFGREVDGALTWTFAKHYTVGAKLALYSAGDVPSARVDADKYWLWFTAGF